MRFLMLRAQINRENFKYMVKEKWDQVDDFYLHLANQLLVDKYVTDSEVWYWGEPEFNITYETGLKIVGKKSFCDFPDEIDFDVIFSRSGFREYNIVFEKKGAREAKKIYYDGVDSRYCPRGMNATFDVILTDTEQRKASIKNIYPDAVVDIFVKGFKPPQLIVELFKAWDLCNITSIEVNKGQRILADALKGSGISFINIGAYSEKTKNYYESLGIDCFFTGRLQRYVVYRYLKQCRMAFVGGHASSGSPRVVLECMAAGVPIILLDDINIDDRYLPDFFCIRTNLDKLPHVITDSVRRVWWTGAIIEYFENNFSMKKCAEVFSRYL